jgi:hypothetical protein
LGHATADFFDDVLNMLKSHMSASEHLKLAAMLDQPEANPQDAQYHQLKANHDIWIVLPRVKRRFVQDMQLGTNK